MCHIRGLGLHIWGARAFRKLTGVPTQWLQEQPPFLRTTPELWDNPRRALRGAPCGLHPPYTAFSAQEFVCVSIEEQLRSRNVKRFRGGLVFKAHRLLYHSTLGLRVIKKKKKFVCVPRKTLRGTSLPGYPGRGVTKMLLSQGKNPIICATNMSALNSLQGYLAHKKQPPPSTLQ